jgi:hypothetical protein
MPDIDAWVTVADGVEDTTGRTRSCLGSSARMDPTPEQH